MLREPPAGLSYYSWPKRYSTDAGPFTAPFEAQMMTTFQLEAWTGRQTLVFCQGRLLAVVKGRFIPTGFR